MYNKEYEMNLIDGAFLKPEDLLTRLILLDLDPKAIEETDYSDLIVNYNQIISSRDNLRLSKIKNLLDQDAERDDFENLLLRKRSRDSEEFSCNPIFENSPNQIGKIR